jgi:hypothetical protein
MNAMPYESIRRECPAMISDEAKSDKPSDAAWDVLEAANDLGDEVAIAACRRVIDANLNGRPVAPSDMHLILEYFR